MSIALDATYSLGDELSGVGIYCREILYGLAASYTEENFTWCYRSHRYLRACAESIPPNCRRFLMHDRLHLPNAGIFHGLNQRMPVRRMRRAVCTFHDLFVMTGEYSTAEFRSRFTQLARDAASRAELIIAVSQFTADQVHTLLGVERSRLRVVHHGVRVNRRVSGQREPMILHVGAIQSRKNIARLISAFACSTRAPWRLVLAGSLGYGAEEILSQIGLNPAKDRIELAGFVSDDALDQLYARASVLAFPSLDEGFGMTVLEAMARGVPVLSSNRSALPEVCGDAALLVDPFDVDEIAGALQRLLRDDALRVGLVQRGLSRSAEFTWERAVEKTYAVYRELIG